MQVHRIVFRVRQAVKKIVQQHGLYLAAVSGGADSMALADACAALQAQGWGRFLVCHVEHGLRGQESLADMAFVQQFCRQRGLEFCCRRVDAGAEAAARHLSTEDAARRLRYQFFYEQAQVLNAQGILLAHHGDDQAETLLLRLLRGAGLDGLSAMRSREQLLLRPFLNFERAALEAYCELEKIACCHDSTNNDVKYTRNRVRLQLLPYLERSFNPSARAALRRTALLLQEDADCLEELALGAYNAALLRENASEIALSAQALGNLQPALRKRVLRLAYFKLGGDELSGERTQALEKLCRNRTGGKIIQLPGAVTAAYCKKRVLFTKK